MNFLVIFLEDIRKDWKQKWKEVHIYLRELIYWRHLHKISLNRGSSYINSPEWLKNKGATINPKNTRDNKCFKYAIITELHLQEIERDPQRISKIKPFINNYDRKDI